MRSTRCLPPPRRTSASYYGGLPLRSYAGSNSPSVLPNRRACYSSAADSDFFRDDYIMSFMFLGQEAVGGPHLSNPMAVHRGTRCDQTLLSFALRRRSLLGGTSWMAFYGGGILSQSRASTPYREICRALLVTTTAVSSLACAATKTSQSMSRSGAVE